MKFLFCCEFYHPSVGGVQEVMRQLAERMVQRGHQVTVATTQLKVETFKEWNGVKIEHFTVSGNEARGFVGDVEHYRDFVLSFPADAILIKAAQQWTFDALFPVLDQIKVRKVFIPCGFSGLYDPIYRDYFERLPEILAKFDRLIFYANRYRDIDYCRAHGLTKLSFIPNGASESEFKNVEPSPDFRKHLGIAEDSFIFSTVGSRTGVKGHKEIAEAFVQLKTNGKRVTLVLNGNYNIAPAADAPNTKQPLGRTLSYFASRAINFVSREGIYRALRRAAGMAIRSFKKRFDQETPEDPLIKYVRLVAHDQSKQVLITNLPRGEVVDLFKASDLFVFASNIEYSPLVLYEAAAAGTPFLTIPVGNSQEIAEITGAGIVCPATKDSYGYSHVDPPTLAEAMAAAMNNPSLLARLGLAGRKSWEERFTWEKIASQYEAILSVDAVPSKLDARPLISVLLPVFNGGKMLARAVHSILSQTLKDFELIVINDGSTDKAVSEIQAFGHPRIHIIGDATRRGLAVRLNEGINTARGKYIARMDADDVAFAGRFEKQVAFLEANSDIDLVGCRAIAFRDLPGGGHDLIGLLPFAARHENICARPWRGFPLAHPTWMGRADWFRRFRYAMPEIKRAEDQELLLRSHEASRFACLPDVLLAYRQDKFDLSKTLIARRYLLLAQESYFMKRQLWSQALLALSAGVVKIGVDVLAAVPGWDRLFFMRMGEKIPETKRREWQDAMSETL